MVLNFLWVGFVLLAFAVGLYKLVVLGDVEVFSKMIESTFDMAKTSFEICLSLAGVMTLWLGIMRVGEKGGAIGALAWVVRPFFSRLFPEVPRDHPVHGTMILNFSANLLGLDNAATPVGLEAMRQLQELNPDKTTASNAQIMFLVLNTSGLTLIPVAILAYRAQAGAANPTDVFLPILLTTFFSTLAGLIAVAVVQRIRLFDPVVLAWLVGLGAGVAALIALFAQMPKERVEVVSTLIANVTLFSVITAFVALAAWRRVDVYETFIEGAKEGFAVVIKILPYLVAMLVAIGVFRASGAMDYLIGAVRGTAALFSDDTRFVEALPTGLMKPLSGSGARGLMLEAMHTHGADSFIGRLVCTFQGATDTTFYIIAVYFGSVGVRQTRHAVPCGLLADLTAVVAGILVAYVFFG
ncbi:MAG: spore maturation protein [Planctomycetes bacterium]|nr:spore maturation protein [Planctomycetota bacterium]